MSPPKHVCLDYMIELKAYKCITRNRLLYHLCSGGSSTSGFRKVS